MPNIVLKTNGNISYIEDYNWFYNDKNAVLYPVELEKEAFFIRMTQKADKLVIKLEKATKPKITNRLKLYMLEFAEDMEKKTSGTIIHHNLNATQNIDYNLYDKYEITPQSVNSVDWINSLCSNEQVSVEIGMGAGEFLTEEALKKPSECFVGIEVLNNEFHTALRRFERAGLNNVKAIYYDVRALLSRFKPDSLETVYINFPEPWFRIKRIKHSVLTQKTVKEMEKSLRKNGKLIIVTDNYPFAVAASNIIEYSTDLEQVYRYPIMISRKNIRTKYEKKWIKYERTIYRLEYAKKRKSEGCAPIQMDFPIKIKREGVINNEYVFKVLNIYKNRHKKQIMEAAAGYAKNPQHIFFSYENGNYIEILPQSNFIINEDFIKSVSFDS